MSAGFAYVAYDRRGRRTDGRIDAESAEQAAGRLREQGMYVVSVTAASRAASRGGGRGRRASLRNVALWAREMLVLVRAGTPVAQALAAIERQQPEGPWRAILADVRVRVEEGSSLGEALGAHPEAFDPVIRSLVAAGESSGRMDEVLARVAEIARSTLKLRQTVIGALVYPCVLVLIGVTVSLVMLMGVVPRFAGLFESMGAALPPSTAVMVAASEHLRAWWWAWAALLAAAVVAGWTLLRTSRGRERLDDWLVRLPVIGRVTRALATARITRVLGVLLQSHVPMLRAIELTREAAGNRRYAELMGRVREAAQRGEPLSSVLARSPLVAPSVAEAVRHGEQSGQVGSILADMTEFLEEENEVIVRSAIGLVEPAILALLGLIVGGMAMSLFIPLFDVAASTGGGP